MADTTLDVTQPFDNPRKLLRLVDTLEGESETKYAIGVIDLGAAIPVKWDAFTISSYDANDNPLTIQYRVGGTSGTIVATVTLVWASATRLTSYART